MHYKNIVLGKFIERPNRFIAIVEIEGREVTVHVKNTGRCRELLLPGATVALCPSTNPERKTPYDLVAVIKPNLGWVNIDSQAPNKVVMEYLAGKDYSYIKPEYQYGKSRIDFYMERGRDKYLMEVKGCTLEIDGRGFFPDAPTKRGVKHIYELIEASKQGYHSILAFVIAMEKVTDVSPNESTDPEFKEAFELAKASGVDIWNLPCRVSADSLEIIQFV